MLHLLCEREENYHDDSDFYAVVFDDQAGAVRRVGVGSTRYASPIGAASYGIKPSADELDLTSMWAWSAMGGLRCERGSATGTVNESATGR